MLYGSTCLITKTSKPASEERSSASLIDLFLWKIFNRNTLRLSYGCMPNVKQLIDGHNKAILHNGGIAQPRQDEEKKCNCGKKDKCSLDGECLVNEVVYYSTVKTKDTKETYIGPTANQFNARYRNHQMSFRH